MLPADTARAVCTCRHSAGISAVRDTADEGTTESPQSAVQRWIPYLSLFVWILPFTFLCMGERTNSIQCQRIPVCQYVGPGKCRSFPNVGDI